MSYLRSLTRDLRRKQRIGRVLGKKRVFWNSILLLVSAPIVGCAAMEGPDGQFPVGDIVFGVIVALGTAIFAVCALRWSLTADKMQA